jgi:hypothetical protein
VKPESDIKKWKRFIIPFTEYPTYGKVVKKVDCSYNPYPIIVAVFQKMTQTVAKNNGAQEKENCKID